MRPLVKICGLTEPTGLRAAVEGGADFIGLVFFPKSPRFIPPREAAALIEGLPDEVRPVGLFVDPTDDELAATLAEVRLDLVQLHGGETPERVEGVRREFAVEVIKAVPVSTSADLIAAEAYVGVADRLLFDAKPPEGADRPGGNARSFDWTLMRGWRHPDWFLAGGLTPETVAEAVRTSGAPGVDVSSGVESVTGRPGRKDPKRIAAFLAACAGL